MHAVALFENIKCSNNTLPLRENEVHTDTVIWGVLFNICIYGSLCVAYLLPYGIQPCLGVTVMIHVLPIAFQLFPPSSFQCRPLFSYQPLPSVLAPLHSVPSSFSPHLPVFCALSTLPPALSVLVQARPLFPLCLPFPLWCCPLTPHPVLPPVPPADVPPPHAGPQIFLFFSWLLPLWVFFGRLITVASKLHTKSQRDRYCKAYNGIQAVMAISNRGAWPVVSCV